MRNCIKILVCLFVTFLLSCAVADIQGVKTPENIVDSTLKEVIKSGRFEEFLKNVNWSEAYSHRGATRKFNSPETMQAWYLKMDQPDFIANEYQELAERLPQKASEIEKIIESSREGELIVRQTIKNLKYKLKATSIKGDRAIVIVSYEGVEKPGTTSESFVELKRNERRWEFVSPEFTDLLGIKKTPDNNKIQRSDKSPAD